MEKKFILVSLLFLLSFNVLLFTHNVEASPSTLNCTVCHIEVSDKWMGSSHAATQADVADELSAEHAGQTPDQVIKEEDCIACHAPTATLANGGMTEAEALGYFFTTTNGVFTNDTSPAHTGEWPNVSCITCHDVPSNHPQSMPQLASYSSETGSYHAVNSSSELCGQCHGNLVFPDTDHQTYNAWMTSKHAATQADVADELSAEHAGQTPDQVIKEEDCIACHAPTATLANGGMTEAEALGYFFTTTNGVFTNDTSPAHTGEWPNVSCITCHDTHNPQLGLSAYFDPASKNYIAMSNTSELCGQCHGNLKFPDTDHLSYNILTGTGGAGVTDEQTMPGVTCIDCHMYISDVDGSNSAMYHGHTFSVTVAEADGNDTSSCTQCHSTINAAMADMIINNDKISFSALDSKAQSDVASATQAMNGLTNSTLKSMLSEAQSNLAYAESDESGGFHNNDYSTSLLRDADMKALQIETAILHQSLTGLQAQYVKLNSTLVNLQNEANTAKGISAQQTYVEIILVVCLVISVSVTIMSRRKRV